MATLLPPSSQKAGDRPISFVLDNLADGAGEGMDLYIRPEELTRQDPSRMAVQQTLGGAWIDNFGAGLAQITISGHTGWKRDDKNNEDGLARMIRLKENVFDQWHVMRGRNVERGIDPDQVRLYFNDNMQERTMVVAPMSFLLRRSKSRPLLAQYQIQMTVVDENLLDVMPNIPFGYEKPAPEMLDLTEEIALESIDFSVLQLEEVLQPIYDVTGAINGVTGTINRLRQMVQGDLVAPVAAFLRTTIDLYSAIRGAIAEGTALTGDLISIARMSAQAGINIFRSLAAVLSIPKIVKAQLIAVAQAYMNIFCTLRNAISLRVFIEDYTSLYGASNCSSTSGGRPQSTFAGKNPFYSVVPTPGPLPVNLTPAAATQMVLLAQADPVLAPVTTVALKAAMTPIQDGFQTNEYLSRYVIGKGRPLPLLVRPGVQFDKVHEIVHETLPVVLGVPA